MSAFAVPGPASVGAHAHVVVGDLATLELDDADRHHLARVLRIRPGEPVTATDGAGRWRVGRAPAGWPSSGDALVADGEVHHAAAHAPRITIGLALTKGDKPELAVQKLTELGVDRVVLLAAAHSVVRWDEDKVTRNLGRLQAIAREALMQSRGVWLPSVEGVRSVASMLTEPGVAMADAGHHPVTLDHPTVLIGPEGGWSVEESSLSVAKVSLGETVLRAETAALACCTLLGALRSGAVQGGDGRSG